jgi:hypothetical protein
MFGGSGRTSSGTISSGGQGNFGGSSAFSGGGGGTGGGTGAQGAGLQSQQGIGAIDGSESFMQQGQFIGADSSDTTNFYSQQGTANAGRNQQNQFRTSGTQNRNTGRNTGGQFGAGGRAGQQSTLPRHLSAQLMVVRPIASQAVNETLGKRVGSLATATAGEGRTLSRPSSISPAATVRVTVQGQTAILQGTVTSEYERQLVEQMARLEPGIWQVRNELTLPSAATETQLTDPATTLPVPANNSR